MKILRRFIVGLVALFSGILSTEAAAPREITIDSLYYFIEDTVARVSPADRKISVANILDSVEIKGVKYPVTIAASFYECPNLVRVEIPATVREIRSRAFADCPRLEYIELPEKLEVLGTNAFEGSTALKSIVIPESITFLFQGMFRGCTGLQYVSLPEGLTKIGQGAFMDCTGLKELQIPEGVGEIGSSCFNGTSIEEITIPHGVEIINNGLFKNCNNLRSVKLPITVTSIEESVFSNTAIATIDIPSRVTSIGIEAFSNCSELEIVNSYNTTPPSVREDAFKGSYPEFITLHVPEGCKEDYAAADGWKDFRTIIDDLPRTTTSVECVSTDVAPEGCEVFSLAGVKVSSSTENLSPGFYFVRKGAACTKILVR